MMRHFQRAARRGGVPVAYSQGFNPHPRMTFASPLPLGATGYRELGAFDLSCPMDPAALPGRLNPHLPDGLRVLECWEVPPGRGTFGSRIESRWRVRLRSPAGEVLTPEDLRRAVDGLMGSDTLEVSRREGETRNVRQFLLDAAPVEARDEGGREAVLDMELLQMGDLSAKPQDVVTALERWAGPLEIVALERLAVITENCNLREVPRPRTGPERAAGGCPESGERR